MVDWGYSAPKKKKNLVDWGTTSNDFGIDKYGHRK